MTENTAIVLNLQSPNISTVVYAVQNDRLARHITAQLLDGAAEWTPPAGALPVVRYLKPDGTAGFYDTDENDDPAIVISGSVATLTLAEQALTVPGDVYMQLNFYTADEQKLTTFAWLLRVQKSVIEDAEIVSSDYFNTLTEKIAEGIEVAQQLTFPVPITNGGTGANNAVSARNNLGLGAAATEDVVPLSKGGTGATTDTAARTALGLGSIATENTPLALGKGGTAATDAAGARSSLGLGDVAVENVLPLTKGGTGATTVADAKANLGIVAFNAEYSAASAGGSATISVGNAARGLIVCSGSTSAFRGLYIFNTTTTGALSFDAVLAASSISISGSSGNITVTNNASSGTSVISVWYTQT